MHFIIENPFRLTRSWTEIAPFCSTAATYRSSANRYNAHRKCHTWSRTQFITLSAQWHCKGYAAGKRMANKPRIDIDQNNPRFQYSAKRQHCPRVTAQQTSDFRHHNIQNKKSNRETKASTSSQISIISSGRFSVLSLVRAFSQIWRSFE